MTTPSRITPTGSRTPRTAVVVGAGMVGLATAWHLQERGVDVTVLDREGVAAGSSWGNAGWLTPGMAMPLADPTLWTYAPRRCSTRPHPAHPGAARPAVVVVPRPVRGARDPARGTAPWRRSPRSTGSRSTLSTSSARTASPPARRPVRS
ncbi:FAD-dependent oxidoreductase [Oerskovia sp. M15]